jgi:hypothetical protein
MVYQYEVVAKMKYIEPGAFTFAVKYPNHYAIDGLELHRVNMMQHKIENVSLKILQMKEVGKYFFTGNVGNLSYVLKMLDFLGV